MNPTRYRSLRAVDLPRIFPLLEQDRPFYTAATWNRLPELLLDLIDRGRVRGAVIEELGNGRLRWVGVNCFVQPEALEAREASLPESVITGKSILSLPQVATANSRRELHQVNLFSCPDMEDIDDPNGFQLPLAIGEAFDFLSAGYGLLSIRQQAAHPISIACLEHMGMIVERKTVVGCVLCYSLEQALAVPSGGLSTFFKTPPPRLHFTAKQQELLTLAVNDITDRELEVWLHLTDETIKKRWQAVYQEVRRSLPELLPQSVTGADQRRILLGYLRQHLEELRPYATAHSEKRKSSKADLPPLTAMTSA